MQLRQRHRHGGGGQPAADGFAVGQRTAREQHGSAEVEQREPAFQRALERRDPAPFDEGRGEHLRVGEDEPAPAQRDDDRAEHGPGGGRPTALALRQHRVGQQAERSDQAGHQPETDRLLRLIGREEGRHARIRHQVGEIEQAGGKTRRAEPDQPATARAAAQVPAEREHHPGNHDREDLQPRMQRQIVQRIGEYVHRRQEYAEYEEHAEQDRGQQRVTETAQHRGRHAQHASRRGTSAGLCPPPQGRARTTPRRDGVRHAAVRTGNSDIT